MTPCAICQTPSLLPFCLGHWRMVPHTLKRRIHREKSLTPETLQLAIEAVKQKEIAP